MGNKFFKFFDIRLAESKTKTGREVLMHMVRHVGKILDGEYAYPTDSVIYGDSVGSESVLYMDDGRASTISSLFNKRPCK